MSSSFPQTQIAGSAGTDQRLARLIAEDPVLRRLPTEGTALLERMLILVQENLSSGRNTHETEIAEIEREFTRQCINASLSLSVEQQTVLFTRIHGVALEKLSGATSSSGLGPVDQLFLAERAALRARLNSDPALAVFRNLSDAMLTFLWSEKTRLTLLADKRVLVDDQNVIKGGYNHDNDCKDDIYHPKHFQPFNVKGYWIPESEGKLFATESGSTCPLVRNGPQGKEVLFLVHPKSESLYAPLIAKYGPTKMDVPALALSSFRTLVVALPTGYAMVKVSIDEKIGGAHRALTLKECAGSVGTTAVLQHKQANVQFLQENMSFVPNGSERGAGMIHRVIPECLLRTESNKYIIPAFSLLGTRNRQLLELLIKQSNMTPTQFLRDVILQPLAELYIDLIYMKHISMEAHGQNLLLSIDTSQKDKVKINFIYRDMGGVNCLFSDADRAFIPPNANHDEYYYLNNHEKDAGSVMEIFIARRILFNLTKGFFKANWNDPEFTAWKSTVPEKYWSNWTIADADPDAHKDVQNLSTFYCYGYCERMFAKLLLDAMENKGVFAILFEPGKPETSREYYEEKLAKVDNPYNEAYGLNWFRALVMRTYPAYKELIP